MNEFSNSAVEIDPLTPEMKRKIVALMQDSIDRELVRAMSGGYDVEINSAGPKGITIEHVRWPRAFLPDSRQESREGGIGPHQPCAGVGATEDQSEG